jgi:large subunit ribosomal protein L21
LFPVVYLRRIAPQVKVFRYILILALVKIMHAVIKTGGKQYRVSPGDKLNVETLLSDAGSDFHFNEVLMISDGNDISVGAPMLEGASVIAKVIEHGRGEKIRIVKFKRRKHYRRQMGHRQNYTRVEIVSVERG